MDADPAHAHPGEQEAPPPVVRTLDDYIAGMLPSLNKRERRRLVARGGITINGRPAADPIEPVGLGDTILLPSVPEAANPPFERPAAPRNGATPGREPGREPRPRTGSAEDRGYRRLPKGVRLIYEDADIIVVDKPPGLVTADPTRTTSETVFDVLKQHVRRAAPGRKRPRPEHTRLWIIHRLDKEASGLLVFARSERAYHTLKEDFRHKRSQRLYTAVAEGVVGPPDHAGTHQSFLQEDTRGHVASIPPSKFRGVPGEDAKLAVTHYRVQASAPSPGPGYSVLRVRLETGRKNQIRVHMADIGHPLAGDQRYGAKTDPMGRLALHAAELGFTHPATGLPVRYSSPTPRGFWTCVGRKEETDSGGRFPDPEFAGEAGEPSIGSPAEAVAPQGRPSGVKTSWDPVANWYDQLLGDRGSDNYEQVILPGVVRMLGPQRGRRVLDVACGQGVLSRRLAGLGAAVTGVDASPRLIDLARRRSSENVPAGVTPPEFIVGDARGLATLALGGFDSAACVMALSNIDPLEPVVAGVAGALRSGGTVVIVLAHPAFRAPEQTSWGWDHKTGKQFRRVDGYLSPGQHRIQMHPGKAPDIVTWTFHRPIQVYVRALAEAGFVVDGLEEWPGMRVSTSGPRAPEENRARREIPLFLAVRAVKR
jgi:RluA family pseudouridine synthase